MNIKKNWRHESIIVLFDSFHSDYFYLPCVCVWISIIFAAALALQAEHTNVGQTIVELVEINFFNPRFCERETFKSWAPDSLRSPWNDPPTPTKFAIFLFFMLPYCLTQSRTVQGIDQSNVKPQQQSYAGTVLFYSQVVNEPASLWICNFLNESVRQNVANDWTEEFKFHPCTRVTPGNFPRGFEINTVRI